MTDLCILATKYGTDKWNMHHYTPHYHRLFKDRRNEVKKVLEIGIGDLTMVNPTGAPYVPGASLRMWEEYFPNAKIYALDIDRKLLINKGRIHSAFCDQSDVGSLRSVTPWLGNNFDLIVDDGSHWPAHQAMTALEYLPLLAPNGFYVIEDVNTFPNHAHWRDTLGRLVYEISVQITTIRCSDINDDVLMVIKK